MNRHPHLGPLRLRQATKYVRPSPFPPRHLSCSYWLPLYDNEENQLTLVVTSKHRQTDRFVGKIRQFFDEIFNAYSPAQVCVYDFLHAFLLIVRFHEAGSALQRVLR